MGKGQLRLATDTHGTVPGSWTRQRVLRADAEAGPGWEVIIQQERSKRSGAEGGNGGDLGSGGLRGNSLGVAM